MPPAPPLPASPSATPTSHDEHSLDMLTYGEAMALFIAETPGELSSVERFTRRLSGADLNVATGLARLGFKVGYISRVGNDAFGQAIRANLLAEGIDASKVSIDARYPTGMQLKAIAAPGTDPVTEYFRRGSAASHLSEDDFDIDYVDRAGHLHLTGVAPAISASSRCLALRLARHFNLAGKTISFDPNLRPTLWPSEREMIEALNELAALATWVLPGLSEGRLLSGADTPEAIAHFYLSMGVQGVVVKLGESGAYFACADGTSGYIPAVPVKTVVDTVGAGDGFAVGVISALAEGATLEKAAQRGALIGALAVQVAGDSEGLPTRTALDALEGRPPSGGQSRPSRVGTVL